VLIERLVSEEGEVRFGRVLASDLTMSGKSLTAFHFERGDRSAFYDADGKSLRRAFLRAPVQFRRISSTFARARRHPVLGITRRHQGTDYAATPGTPVMAAGDGVVLRASRAGGYGNLIELRHRNGIVTRYGHLRGFARGIRARARVSQGQTTASPRTPGASSSATARRSAPATGTPSSGSATACSRCSSPARRSR
jgi:murein DD-endopeptidase MepM/ murein hydrolase activator NlpD